MKRRTPTQLMVHAGTPRSLTDGPRRDLDLEDLARFLARGLADNLPAGLADELIPWLGTPQGAKAFRDCWPRIVEAYRGTLQRG
jgi:hypothetical protein